MKKALVFALVLVLVALAACRNQEPALEASMQASSESAAEGGLEDIDSVESDLSSDELNDMEDSFSEIENI